MTINIPDAVRFNRRAAYLPKLRWFEQFDQIAQVLREETNWGAAYFAHGSPSEEDFATAVGEWQYNNGLVSDGKLGTSTWEKLRGKASFSGGIGASYPIPSWLSRARPRTAASSTDRSGVHVEQEITLAELPTLQIGRFVPIPRLPVPLLKVAFRLHPFEAKLHLIAGSANPQWEVELPFIVQENQSEVGARVEIAVIRQIANFESGIITHFKRLLWSAIINCQDFSASEILKDAFTLAVGGQFRIKNTTLGEIEGRGGVIPVATEFQLFPYPIVGIYFATLNFELVRSQDFSLDLSGLSGIADIPNPRCYVSGNVKLTMGFRYSALYDIIEYVCKQLIQRGIMIRTATAIKWLLDLSAKDLARYGFRLLFTGVGGIITATLVASAAITAASMYVIEAAQRDGQRWAVANRYAVGFVREALAVPAPVSYDVPPEWARAAQRKGRDDARRLSAQMGSSSVRETLRTMYGTDDPQRLIEKLTLEIRDASR